MEERDDDSKITTITGITINNKFQTATIASPSTCMTGVTVTATDIGGNNNPDDNDDNSVVSRLSILDEDRLGTEKEA
eukprot:14332181-Ditylum_brightwellii.AAC.1